MLQTLVNIFISLLIVSAIGGVIIYITNLKNSIRKLKIVSNLPPPYYPLYKGIATTINRTNRRILSINRPPLGEEIKFTNLQIGAGYHNMGLSNKKLQKYDILLYHPEVNYPILYKLLVVSVEQINEEQTKFYVMLLDAVINKYYQRQKVSKWQKFSKWIQKLILKRQ